MDPCPLQVPSLLWVGMGSWRTDIRTNHHCCCHHVNPLHGRGAGWAPTTTTHLGTCTRIVSQSSTFCQTITLQDTSSTAATLYLLREKPQLTGHDNFTVKVPFSIDPDENYYKLLSWIKLFCECLPVIGHTSFILSHQRDGEL